MQRRVRDSHHTLLENIASTRSVKTIGMMRTLLRSKQISCAVVRLTLSSRLGGGVSKARMVVMTGPSRVHTTMLSLSMAKITDGTGTTSISGVSRQLDHGDTTRASEDAIE